LPRVSGTFTLTPRQHVKVYVGEFEENVPNSAQLTMTAYDASGNLITQSHPVTVYPGAGFHTPLEVDSPTPNIASFEISGRAPGPNDNGDVEKNLAIDDLTFDNPTVVQPDFSLLPATSVIEVGPGQAVVDGITINRYGGSSGDIQFAASGLPPGVTATFAPNPAGGASTRLIVTAAPDAPTTDTGSMTVTATPLVPGAGPATRAITLDVQVRPDFTVGVEGPTEVNLPYGGPALLASNITVPVTVTRQLAFQNPPIDLSVSGLPAGVTASFDTPTVGAPPDGGLVNHVQLTLTAQPRQQIPGNFVLDLEARNGLETSHASLIVHGVAPFDLVWDAVDDNGIPKNPEWGWQVAHPGPAPDPDTICRGEPLTSPPCTTQAPSIDVPTGWNAFWCNNFVEVPPARIHGHVNWMPATYEGKIYWDSHSSPGADDDYNLMLQTEGLPGQTQANNGRLKIEFDSDETIDHFHTPIWEALHAAVDESDDLAHAAIDGKFAIVTGLLGLDSEHNSHSELHPAYAVAIRANDDPSDETWAIFVRNWGNEGYCSQDQHYVSFPNNQCTIRLPWLPGASSVSVREGETQFLTNSDQTAWGITWAPNQGSAFRVFGIAVNSYATSRIERLSNHNIDKLKTCILYIICIN